MTDLDAERLVAQAVEATGLDDFDGDAWREGLDRLVDSLVHEAALHELGVAIVEGELLGYLTTRLQVVDWHRRHPEIATADVTPPIVIIGQARTGTTILFDLMAQDPAHRVPLTWEVDRPVPPPETATYDTDPRIDEVDATLAGVELVLPGFRNIHPLGARLAQECVRITALDFKSMIFPTQYRVPSYLDWLLDEADHSSSYAFHRRFLQLLQWRCPGERWLLKSPAHVWTLPQLLAEYPGALLVQTHRDPLRVLASVSSLMGVLRRLASDDISVPAIAREFERFILEGFDRTVEARDDGTLAPDRVGDVSFREFMADPFAAVGDVYRHLGLPLTDDADARMRTFYAAHGSEHVKHDYTFADTGLDLAVTRARAARYQTCFDVPSEAV